MKFFLFIAVISVFSIVPAGADDSKPAAKWLSTLAAKDGELIPDSAVLNHYKNNRINISGDTIELLHDNPAIQGYFNFDLPEILDVPGKLIVTEWRCKLLATGNSACFEVSIAPKVGKNNRIWGFFFRFFPTKATVAGRNINLSGINLRDWNTFRAAIDTKTGEAVFWVNGKNRWKGKIPFLPEKAYKYPFILIGDSSMAITGNIALKYFKIGYVK